MLVPSNERKGLNMSSIKFNAGRRNSLSCVQFELDNGVILSVGVSASHNVSPPGEGGLFPERDIVEIALLDPKGRGFLTRQFFKDEMGETLGDDVTTLESSKLMGFMHRVSLWERG
tara:strand:+ start:2465 stop:2812 length:348 start_codon:yes stop_codon:yes gene_type:complete